MGKALHLLSLSIMPTLFLAFGVAGKHKGLTLTLLLRPDSILSRRNPIHDDNIIHNPRSIHHKIVRPRIKSEALKYVVKIGIGTFNSIPAHTEFYLEMDTGGGLVWTQCEGCTKCFKQTPKPFSKNASKSFRPIPCKDRRICMSKRCNGLYCAYAIRYPNNTLVTSGFLAQETFTFLWDKGKTEKVKSVVFGCGMYNSMKAGGKTNRVAGVMGLGWGPNSFVNQIGFQSSGKFSYCLPVVNRLTPTPTTYLRFGRDVRYPRFLHKTALLRNGNAAAYYLEMQGISLDGQKLNFNETAFALRTAVAGSVGGGGCTIDSTIRYSRLIKPAYEVLKRELQNYFSKQWNLKRYYSNPLKLGLCYERDKPEGFRNLPTITIHFKGYEADLVLTPEGSFEVIDRYQSRNGREYFCLGMAPDDRRSTIGAHQQMNQLFIFDTNRKQLFFSPEDCSKNA